ncbi:MAG: ABC transporter ATP-binding protein [Planctomycetes bacterium]|nr:ABC transporter ATP-binding protein [Planctomycetota bacterium]
MPLLDIRNLRKTFRSPDGSEALILDVPGFALEAGEHVALSGGSGSGKTTLLNVISGILAPDAGGAVVLDGEDMAALPESRRDALRARAIGFIFQTFNLLQGFSALENVLLGMMLGRGGDEEEAKRLLGRVGLAGRLRHRPRQLSVGQQQRVAVARALANRPKLVLADEPTGNLDARSGREALALIREVCRESGAALLLVSHDPAVLDGFEKKFDLASLNRAAGGAS